MANPHTQPPSTPITHQLSKPLAKILGLEHGTRPAVVAAFHEFLKHNSLLSNSECGKVKLTRDLRKV